MERQHEPSSKSKIGFVLSEINREVDWAERFVDETGNAVLLDSIYNELENVRQNILVHNAQASSF